MKYNNRNDIPNKYKVDLSELFKTEEDFNKEIDDLYNYLDKIRLYNNKVYENLYEILELDTNISKRIERLFIYAHINNDIDLSNDKYNKFYGNVIKLNKKYSELSSYIVPELMKYEYNDIEKLYKKDKRLLEYEILLKDIFRKKEHVLSEKEEKIITKLSDAFNIPEDTFSKLTDVDLKFGSIKDENNKKIEINNNNYATYLESKNRNVRKNAFKTLYKGYESIINTNTELLSGQVKLHNGIADVRKYNSSLEASLISNEVDNQVYQTLIKSINDNINIIHKQWELRKKILGVKDLHLYDTYVPLVNDYAKKYTFDEGKELIFKSLKPLGEDYIEVLKEAFDKRWIDVYPTKNKRMGGYCTACYLTHPYVFLNFDGRFDEVSTIAHELGHAMHYHYAIKNNSYQNYSYTIFVAEVASQVNELLLSYYMLDNATNKEDKLYIIDELIKRFKASVVRQTMFSEFELDIHELEQNGEVLTKDLLCNHYYDLNKKYFGNKVKIDKEIMYEWSRIPHFYYNFYVYQYATGYVAAMKIAKDIYNNNHEALNNYKKFLKLGCTVNPVDSLKIAGVDLTDEKVYTEAFKEFDSYLNLYLELLKEEV